MRFYAMGNMYLSSIQQGIQAAHALGDMVVKYHQPELKVDYKLYDWLENHKTMVLLNGGRSVDLAAMLELISRPENTDLPFGCFREDEDSLQGILTTVAIILPERLYGVPREEIMDNPDMTDWEKEVMMSIKSMSLAR